MKTAVFNESAYGYLTTNILVASVGIFLFFKCTELRNKAFATVIGFLDRYSYGIYLVHVLVLNYLNSIGITPYFTYPLIGIPVVTVLCLGLSAGIIFTVNKLPFVGKHISG